MINTKRALLCLIMVAWVHPAWGGPVALVSEVVTDELAQSLGLSVCRVYIEFEYPEDTLLSVGFSNVSTDAPNGFYQDISGNDTAPPALFCTYPGFESLCLDSYVTIGVDDSTEGDGTALDPDWDSKAFNNDGQVTGGWYAIPPGVQGTPDEDLLVLVAQFSIPEGFNVSGWLRPFYNTGREPAPFLFMSCFCPGQPPTDVDGDNYTNGADLAQVLIHWGPCAGCPADVNDDGEINATDLSTVLGNWGPCLQ